MARYPQGVRNFIPSYQAYQPDFTSMAKMLKIKQNKYDQNWKQLNKQYGALLYSETTHTESQEVKDQLKNEIDFNLRRVSGLDLSLEQNVQAASQVFQPFYENSSLMYDMAATKNVGMAKSKAGSYKNASDPELQKQYWNDGMKEIDYRVQEFKETPYDQIQSSGLTGVGYTPYVDVGVTAEKLAKEFGDIKSQPTRSADGRYMITTTNGPAQLMQPLEQLYQMRMANDPRIQAMYKTQAYVDRKDYMYQNAGEYGGDAQAAERAYLENEYNVLSGGVKKTNAKLKKNEEALNTQSQILQEGLENGSAPAGAEEVLNTVETNKEVVNSNLQLSNVENDMVKDSSSNGTTSTGQSNPFEDINVLRNKVDFLRANSAMQKDFKQAAYVYSKRNMKTETTEDKFALADYKDKLARQRDYDKARVESGTAIYEQTPNGPVVIDVKGRNNWQSEGAAAGVTAPETDQREVAEMAIQSDWEEASRGTVQGIDIAGALDLENTPEVNTKLKKILNKGDYRNENGQAVDANNRPLTLASIKQALQSGAGVNDFRAQTGLSLSEVYDINDTLLDLMSNDKTTATLIDAKFTTQADKDKVIQFKKQALQNKIELVAIDAEKDWLKENTVRLINDTKLKRGQAVRNAQYMVDANTGAVLSEEQYYDNALKAIVSNRGKDDFQANQIRKYLRDKKRYNEMEATLDKKAAENLKANFFSKQYWKGLGQATSSSLNLYKDFDDFIGPDVVFGELLIAANIEDYDTVKEAWTKEWKNSANFKDAPPSSYGSGTGISSIPSSAVVTPQAGHAKPTQEFYGYAGKKGIYEDYQDVKNLGTTGVLFSGVGTGKNAAGEDSTNSAEHQRIARLIWDAHGDPSSFKKGQGFKAIVSPTTGLSGTKAAYTIMPDSAVLDELVPTGSTDEEKALYKTIKADLLSNGASVIADGVKFDSYTYEAASSNDIEADLKGQVMKTGNDGNRKWTMEPGFGMEFKLSEKYKTYSITQNYKAFDLNTYLATGKLVNSSTSTALQNGETLQTQLNTYQESIIPMTKADNQEKVSLVRYLKKNNPGITDKQIREIFETYNFQYNLS